jgi:hypothetical protein
MIDPQVHEPHLHFESLCALLVCGQTSPEEEAEIQSHAAGCARCRSLIAEYLRLDDELARVAACRGELIEESETGAIRMPANADKSLAGDMTERFLARAVREGIPLSRPSRSSWIAPRAGLVAALVLVTVMLGMTYAGGRTYLSPSPSSGIADNSRVAAAEPPSPAEAAPASQEHASAGKRVTRAVKNKKGLAESLELRRVNVDSAVAAPVPFLTENAAMSPSARRWTKRDWSLELARMASQASRTDGAIGDFPHPAFTWNMAAVTTRDSQHGSLFGFEPAELSTKLDFKGNLPPIHFPLSEEN